MRKKPILVVLAAGMGSRYGGLKQIDPVGPSGEVIMDYSLYDAKRAGFETVVFIIKHEIEEAFKETVGQRAEKFMEVRYAYQQLDDLPEGCTLPEGREKPLGTGHAILAARDVLDAPFAVINADDYYGPSAFKTIYDYLASDGCGVGKYGMVAYRLDSTVTEHGTVARGLCQVDENGHLVNVVERTKIGTYEGGIHFTEDDGATWTDVPVDTPVSMNLWGFDPSFVGELKTRFVPFMQELASTPNPLKTEFLLPTVVGQMLTEGTAVVTVLHSADKWYGVTYKEDKPGVVEALAKKVADGLYPTPLWK